MRKIKLTATLVLAAALLAGCNGGESAKPEPHAIATYVPATWKDLPQVSDDDLLAGFYACLLYTSDAADE